jgi:hypothetical protein
MEQFKETAYKVITYYSEIPMLLKQTFKMKAYPLISPFVYNPSFHPCALCIYSVKRNFSVELLPRNVKSKKKVKLSRYTPWRHMGGEEV